jgi:hypothetical protein
MNFKLSNKRSLLCIGAFLFLSSLLFYRHSQLFLTVPLSYSFESPEDSKPLHGNNSQSIFVSHSYREDLESLPQPQPNETIRVVRQINGKKIWAVQHNVRHPIDADLISELKKLEYSIAMEILSPEDTSKLPIGMPFRYLLIQDRRKPLVEVDQEKVQKNITLLRNIYKSFSKAQDGEDIWLYENAFYRKRKGVILESGALDGYSLSTSYFFEYFAGWKAIHLGKYNFRNIMLFDNRIL